MTRGLSATRAVWGLALVAAPERLALVIARRSVDARVSAVIRVLGARELVQAAVTLARPRRGILLAGAAVDATHSASMAALAGLKGQLRALAATSAAVSATFGGASATVARRWRNRS